MVVIPRVVIVVDTETCYIQSKSRNPMDPYAASINANGFSARASTSLGICSESEPTIRVANLRSLRA